MLKPVSAWKSRNPSNIEFPFRRRLWRPTTHNMLMRSHVSSGGRLINCLAEAKLLCHLILMHLPSISFSTTRLPVYGQLLHALMNLGSLQPRSGVSSVSLLQSHRLRSSRWCLFCLTSSARLTLCRRGYSRRASACLRRSCAGCSVGPSNMAFRRVWSPHTLRRF